MRVAILLVCVAFLAGGCISERHGGARAQERRPVSWQVGRTTARDVVARWGNPDFVAGETWVWWNVDALGGKFRAAYMGLGVTVSNLRQGMSEFRLTFGPDGLLKSVDTTQTLPGGPNWSVNPL